MVKLLSLLLTFASAVCFAAPSSVRQIPGPALMTGSFKIGTSGSPAASSLLELSSTSKGFLISRMSATQRNAISSPATGLMIFNTDDVEFNYWDGDSWERVAGSPILTANRAVVTNGSGLLSASAVTSTTLGYLDIGSSLTTLLGLKAPLASPTFTGTLTGPYSTAGPVITTSGGVTSSEAQLAITRGGTGQSTANAALNALLPSQTSANQKYLRSNGTNTSWESAGSGGGSKNYLGVINGTDNGGDFEGNTAGSWVLGNVTLTSNLPTGTPTFGSGASGQLSIFATSTTPLSGTYSLVYRQATVGTTAGNFLASPAFTIDQSDQAKVMTFKFSYKASSGTMSFPGTSSNSFGVAIYDVTNSAWIIPAGVWGMTQGSGVGIATGTFQTTANSTQYRLVVFNANATGGPVDVYYDDFSLGPIGAATDGRVIDLQLNDSSSITPSGTIASSFGSATNINFNKTPVKDSVAGYSSGTYTVSVAGDYFVLANLDISHTASTGTYVAVAIAVNNTQKILNAIKPSTLGTAVYPFAQGLLTNLKPGDVISVRLVTDVTAPSFVASTISNLVISRQSGPTSGDEGRIVSFNGTQTSQAVTAGVTNLTLTAAKDSHAAWTGTTYVVPVVGDYVVVGGAITSAAGTVRVFKNSSHYSYLSTVGATSASSGSALLPGCVPGDVISIRTDNNSTISNGNFSIFRLSGPSVAGANESVSALYTGNVSGTLTSSYNATTFSTKVADTHNAYSSGVYTVPVTGKYTISAQDSQAATYASGNLAAIAVFVNGVMKYEGVMPTFATTSNMYPQINVVAIPLNVGDLVTIRSLNTGTGPTFAASTTANFFSIARVGN